MSNNIVPPAFANYPMGGVPVFKPSNVFFSDVYQGTLPNTQATVLTLGIGGILTLPKSGFTFPGFTNVGSLMSGFVKTAYVAATNGIYTVTVSGTPVTNRSYMLNFISGNGQYNFTIVVVAYDTTANDLATQINTAIGYQTGSTQLITATVSTDVVTITEVSAATSGGFVISSPNAGMFTIATSTASVTPFGTVAQVQQYKSTVTTGTYNRYRWTFNVKQKNLGGFLSEGLNPVYVDLFVDTGGTNYATFDSLIQSYSPGTNGMNALYNALIADGLTNTATILPRIVSPAAV